MKGILKNNVKIFAIFFIFVGIVLSLCNYSFAAGNAKLEHVRSDSKGVIISVSGDKDIKEVFLYIKDSNGKDVLFYKDKTINSNSKQYFISNNRLINDGENEIKAIVYYKDGDVESTAEAKIDKKINDPTPSPSVTPSTTPTATVSPSNTATAKPSSSPSSSPSNTITPSSTTTNRPSSSPTVSTSPSPSSTATPVKSVKLNKSSVNLFLDKTTTVKLKATISPNKSQKIKWSTSNKKVATVDSTGKVTAKGSGKATITCTVGGVKATCKITVYKNFLMDKVLSTSNSERYLDISPNSRAWMCQSFCVTPKYYVCALINTKTNATTLIKVYDKKTKKLVNSFFTNCYHANGMTYNSKNNTIYIVYCKEKKYASISASKIASAKKFSKMGADWPSQLSGITYDNYTSKFYSSKGTSVKVYDNNLKKVSSLTRRTRVGLFQDIGSYKGILLDIDYKKKGESYIYLYRIKDKKYLGKYKVTLPGELESISYDPDNKEFVLQVYIEKSVGSRLYKTKAIDLDRYVIE